MEKSPDAFRTISEVADWLGVQAHVLRFWESKFAQVKPVKRAGGRRYYRPADMQLLGGIKKLLHDDGLTIKGVQKLMREQGVAHVSSQSKDLDSLTGDTDPADAARDVTPDGSDTTVLQFRGTRGGPAPDDDADAPSPAKQAAAEKPVAGDDTPGGPPAPPAAQEKPVLPSFLHRPAASAAADGDAPATEPEPAAPEPAEPAVAAMVVDAPDPPPDDQIDCRPGVLARLAQIDRLTPEQARAIAPVADDLRALVNRPGG